MRDQIHISMTILPAPTIANSKSPIWNCSMLLLGCSMFHNWILIIYLDGMSLSHTVFVEVNIRAECTMMRVTAILGKIFICDCPYNIIEFLTCFEECRRSRRARRKIAAKYRIFEVLYVAINMF